MLPGVVEAAYIFVTYKGRHKIESNKRRNFFNNCYISRDYLEGNVAHFIRGTTKRVPIFR